jgi:hypothetical protein
MTKGGRDGGEGDEERKREKGNRWVRRGEKGRRREDSIRGGR